MNCPSCNHDGAVFHCTHCGHNWDAARLEALEVLVRLLVTKAMYDDDPYTPRLRQAIDALNALEVKG